MINEQLARRFHERFRGLERVYGTYAIKEREGLKLKGQARTLVGTVTDTLWLMHLAGDQSIGVVPIDDDATCRWGVIDVDVYEGLDFAAVQAQVEEHGLPLVLCTTKSGGLHLFLFTHAPVDAELVRDRLSQWAFLLGYPTAEVFPKQTRLASRDDVGNWLNMPYFDATTTTRYAVVDGRALSPEEFLDLAEERAVDREFLETFKLNSDPLLEGAPPCLMYLCRYGVPEGGRNNALFQLSVYAKKRWPDEWEDRARELNEKFLNPPLPTREVEMLLRSLRRKEYQYKCGEPPMKSACDKAMCRKMPWGITDAASGPGVQVRDLVKYDTRPPVWFLTVEDQRVCLHGGTRVLLDQSQFAQVCVESAHNVPYAMKADKWRELIQGLLDSVEVVEVPEDAGVDGVLFDLVEGFCTEAPKGSNPEDLLSGAVLRDGDTWQFRSRDLMKHLETAKFTQREPHQIWARLKGLGGESGTVMANGKRVRYWTLPAGIFTEEKGPREVRVKPREF